MDTKVLKDLVDRFKAAEFERRRLDAMAMQLKQEENALKAELMAAMQESDTRAASGSEVVVTVAHFPEPVIQDWTAFTEYMSKIADFSLIERRPAKLAIKERWADGVGIPGIGTFTVTKLLVNKLRS